jgi:hypothetical protein
MNVTECSARAVQEVASRWPSPSPPTHLLFFLSFLTTRPNGMRRRFCGTCQNRPGASRIKKCCPPPPPSVSYTHAPYYRSTSSSSFRGCNNNWWQKERRGRLVRHYYTIHLNALSKNRPAPPQGPKHTHTQKEKNDATFENIRSICSTDGYGGWSSRRRVGNCFRHGSLKMALFENIHTRTTTTRRNSELTRQQ